MNAQRCLAVQQHVQQHHCSHTSEAGQPLFHLYRPCCYDKAALFERALQRRLPPVRQAASPQGSRGRALTGTQNPCWGNYLQSLNCSPQMSAAPSPPLQ